MDTWGRPVDSNAHMEKTCEVWCTQGEGMCDVMDTWRMKRWLSYTHGKGMWTMMHTWRKYVECDVHREKACGVLCTKAEGIWTVMHLWRMYENCDTYVILSIFLVSPLQYFGWQMSRLSQNCLEHLWQAGLSIWVHNNLMWSWLYRSTDKITWC